MVAIASTEDELRKALIARAEEIIVVDAELADNIGKYIERLNFQTEGEFENRVKIATISLIIGTTLLTNFMAFGFLVGFKVLLIPEIILFIIVMILLAIKLKNLIKHNYEIVKHDEEGLFLRYKLS